MNRGTRPDAAIRDAYVATLTRYAMLQWSKKKKIYKVAYKTFRVRSKRRRIVRRNNN